MPVSMMVPLNVNRSTIAAQRRGSVNVFVQPENDSFDAIAIDASMSSGALAACDVVCPYRLVSLHNPVDDID